MSGLVLNSLSSKSDRGLMSQDTLQQSFQEYNPLTADEQSHAHKDLKVFYRQRETVYADPPYKNQAFCLFSWIPSKNATPDENGVYGMIKVRGAFDTEDEMNTRAEYLINHCDSFHRIYHANMGRPLPLTLKEDFVKDIKFVKAEGNEEDIIHTSVEQDQKEEEKVQKELNERVKIIREEEKKGSDPVADPIENYIQNKVKVAFNMAAIDNFRAQIAKSQEVIRNAHQALCDLDAENPDFADGFMNKYNETRKAVGMPDSDTVANEPGMEPIKYMRYKPEDLDAYL